MAYQQGIPTLVLREEGDIADGILEKGILPNYMPSFNTRSSVKSYLAGREWQQIFQQWFIDVHKCFQDRAAPFQVELSPEPFFQPLASIERNPLKQATASLQRVTISPGAQETSTGQISTVGTPVTAAVTNPTATQALTEADRSAIIDSIYDHLLSATPTDWEQMPACKEAFDAGGLLPAVLHIAHNVAEELKLRLIRGTTIVSKQDIQTVLEKQYNVRLKA